MRHLLNIDLYATVILTIVAISSTFFAIKALKNKKYGFGGWLGKGKYYFKKISNINQTQGNAHSLTNIRGWIEFEKLLKELPSIFARTVDEVITLGLNCCKD